MRVAVAPHVAERLEVRVGVHDQPEATHVRPDRDADVRDPAGVYPHTRVLRVGRAGHAVLPEQIDYETLKFCDVPAGRHPECIEWEYGVARDLTGDVEHDPPAAAYPPHRPTAGVKVFRARADVRAAPGPADGDPRRVVAQDERGGVGVAADLVRQPPLEGEQRVELESAEQVRRKRPTRPF